MSTITVLSSLRSSRSSLSLSSTQSSLSSECNIWFESCVVMFKTEASVFLWQYFHYICLSYLGCFCGIFYALCFAKVTYYRFCYFSLLVNYTSKFQQNCDVGWINANIKMQSAHNCQQVCHIHWLAQTWNLVSVKATIEKVKKIAYSIAAFEPLCQGWKVDNNVIIAIISALHHKCALHHGTLKFYWFKVTEKIKFGIWWYWNRGDMIKSNWKKIGLPPLVTLKLKWNLFGHSIAMLGSSKKGWWWLLQVEN